MRRLLWQRPCRIVGLQNRHDLAFAHAPRCILDQPLFAREVEIHRCRVLREKKPPSSDVGHRGGHAAGLLVKHVRELAMAIKSPYGMAKPPFTLRTWPVIQAA